MRRVSTIIALALCTLLCVSISSAQQTATTTKTTATPKTTATSPTTATGTDVTSLVRSDGTHRGAPGGWTQAQVQASIVLAVAYIDSMQNRNGSFGASGDPVIATTGMALVAYSVLANGNFSSLPPNYQLHVTNAISWLLTQQNVGGYWADFNFYETYSTGIALAGLSSFAVNPGVPASAIINGRTFLINEFQGPVYTGCSSADGSPTSYYCGGWNYEPDIGRSDESNTGYAMFGLQLTGGIPASIVPDNINWQHHIQEITGNPFATRNDGGGSYQPQDCVTPSYICSNANDTGTMIFSLGYNGVAGSDPHVVAGLALGQDVLDVYELEQPTDNMVYHTGAVEDGSCVIGSPGCDWAFSGGEGGFHYSLFSLSKGLGEFIPPALLDPTNWYAKVVDLLLTQQNTDGSWPEDGRDDATALVATAFSVGALGEFGVPGYIEICKASNPSYPVTGLFTFTATTPGFNSGPISIPVGQCSGSIRIPSGAVTVTETPVLGVAVSDVTALAYDELGFQHNELDSWTLPDLQAIVTVNAGDVEEETLTTFTNYAAPPGLLKLCKIAGSGTPVGTPFVFTVTAGGTRNMYTIPAGPPDQGGYCMEVGTFPVNTPVTIAETPKPPFTPTSITVSQGQLGQCRPHSIYCVVATIDPGITEVDFTNSVACSGNNLLTNGSFETGNFNGWTTGGNFTDTMVETGPFYDYSGAQSGSYYAALGPVGSDGTLSQTFATIPNQAYAFCFWFASVGDNPSNFTALWDNTPVLMLTNPNTGANWTQYIFLEHGSGSDSITFQFRDDPEYMALDNVQVTDPHLTRVPRP